MGGVRVSRVRRKFLPAFALAGLLLTAAIPLAETADAAEPIRPDAPSELGTWPVAKNGTADICGWIGATNEVTGVLLTARLTSQDPDGVLISAEFKLYDVTAPDTPVVERRTPNVGKNTVVNVGVGTLEDGHNYRFTVQARTDDRISDLAESCTFGVDKTPPSAPVITSEDWPDDGREAKKGAGETGTFHVALGAGASDVVCYSHVFDDSLPIVAPCTPVSAEEGGFDVTYTPDTWGSSTLQVRVEDRAGNRGSARYSFYVPSVVVPGPTCETYDGFKLCGAVLEKYLATGGQQGPLGKPLGDEISSYQGFWRFEHGAIFWHPYYPSDPAHELHGPLYDKFLEVHRNEPDITYHDRPAMDVSTTPDGRGAYVHFVPDPSDPAPFGAYSLYWSPETGAHNVSGAVRDKWAALGWERGPLGYPTTDVAVSSTLFQRGGIYWSQQTGYHEVHGAIYDKWKALGGSGGFLGYPITDELTTPDGRGRYSHFQYGSVYWTPETSAHEVHGTIRDKWAALGWERGLLGYPVTDELTTPDGRGRYVHFQYGGSVYWTLETGAHEVYGSIRAAWAAQGWERGPLGYPVHGEYTPAAGQRRSDFQGGYILWDARTNSTRTVLK